jgi:predicted aconitase
MPLTLTDDDRALAAGEAGEAVALAMRIIVRLAEANDAPRLIDVTSAHVDSCLYHGQAGLDFAERLVAGGGRVRIPTTLNVSSLDLLHPDLFRGDDALAEHGRRLMAAYVALGGEPTWTCAPYQSQRRPALGEHIAWAESNAIVFANSVLGARTDRYGDFTDVCAALTGRVPEAGLHLDEGRRARAVFRLDGIGDRLLGAEVLYPVLGHLIGRVTGTLVPAIVGLPTDASEDALKALGAAAASSGGVAMFHAVGRTPEAASLEDALGGGRPDLVVDVDPTALRAARDELSTAAGGPLAAVSVGTPHFSLDEFRALVSLLDGRSVAAGIDLLVSTGREVLAEAAAEGLIDPLRRSGAEIVTDTCTYVTPILRDTEGVVMTNSGKWAYYAPGNLGVDVAFGSLEDCVESAVVGRIVRDQAVWGG